MAEHTPVLLQEVLTYAKPESNQNFVDATFGGGGHARAILAKIGTGGRLFAFDLNPEAVAGAKVSGRNLVYFQDNFCFLEERVRSVAPQLPIHGILFDLGVSSDELADPSLGLSFQTSGPLDMRLAREGSMTAALVVNSWSERDLAEALKEYGEEREAKRIARAIVDRRTVKLFTETIDLAQVVASVIASSSRRAASRIHPATKTFQALRIVVNHELDNLRIGLASALRLLTSGGRLLVISFHSLEDRIVKEVFREATRQCVCPPETPVCTCRGVALASLVTKKPITPSVEEVATNPRARSAKLRVLQKV